MKIKRSSRLYKWAVGSNQQPETVCDLILLLIIRGFLYALAIGGGLFMVALLAAMSINIGYKMWGGSVNTIFSVIYETHGVIQLIKFGISGFFSIILLTAIASTVFFADYYFNKIDGWYKKYKNKHCSKLEVID